MEMSCDKCRRAPALRKAWGCDQPSQTAVKEIPGDEGGVLEYFSCPMLFIPKSVMEWWARYRYMKEFPHTAPTFDELGERFRAFESYYNGRLEEFRELKKRVG